jgi:hypothetical protein
MTNKVSNMEMAEKVLEIILNSHQMQQAYLRTELYLLFNQYELKKKEQDEEMYNEGLV